MIVLPIPFGADEALENIWQLFQGHPFAVPGVCDRPHHAECAVADGAVRLEVCWGGRVGGGGGVVAPTWGGRLPACNIFQQLWSSQKSQQQRINSVLYNTQCCGSEMFIPDPNFLHPGSATKNLTPKKVTKHSEIWSGFLIRDPEPDLLPISDPGSGSATLSVQILNDSRTFCLSFPII